MQLLLPQSFIEGNITLATDVLTFIDLSKLNLKSKLKLDLTTLDNTESYNVVYEGDDGYSLADERQ